MVRLSHSILASTASIAFLTATTTTTTEAVRVTIRNTCSHPIALWDNINEENVSPGAVSVRDLPEGFSGMFRHGRNPQATLAEFAISNGRPWYDISIIPTGSVGPGYCPSLDECKRVTGGVGFNVPMQIIPQTNIGRDTCSVLTCQADGCPDAYLYPKDDIKTHNCPPGTDFDVVFCPGGNQFPPAPETSPPTQETTQPPITQAPTEEQQQQAPTETPTSAPSSASGSGSFSMEYMSTPLDLDGEVTESAPVENHFIDKPTEKVLSVSKTPEPVVNVTTKSSGGDGNVLNIVVGSVLFVAIVVAIAAVVAIRSKKKTLDEEPKSPLRYDSFFSSIESPYVQDNRASFRV